MERPSVTVHVDENGVVSVEADISAKPDPEVLVPLAPSDVAREEGEIRDITSHRFPRWMEVAGGF